VTHSSWKAWRISGSRSARGGKINGGGVQHFVISEYRSSPFIMQQTWEALQPIARAGVASPELNHVH
jgi:hypothetical protein